MKRYFFAEDFIVLEKLAKTLREKIKKLGKEQGEAVKQSTEIFGHDDACQEAIYQERQVVSARLQEFRQLINNSVVVSLASSYDVVRIGAVVKLSDGRVMRIGSFMVFAEHPLTNISYDSPLGRVLIGKKEGDEIEFRGKTFTIEHVR